MPEKGRIAVLGVGNELRQDDAVGVVVARRLSQIDLPEGVEVIEGHVGGINLLFEIEDADWAIIVDAVDMGKEPGAVEVFDASEADVHVVERTASLHHVSLADVLQLAELTGVSTRVTLVGVQPETTMPGEGLSDTVAGRVEEVVELVRGLLQSETAAKGEGHAE
ncbi:MAG: hydrogenase maturation protease [Armatimonadetes bacterium]|nr:hydrogenase maturation protease [Armatimonadota bacterium]